MTPEKLIECIGCAPARASRWIRPLNSAMDCFDINSPARQAGFLAQIGHESGLLTVIEENLNYSAEGLLKIFGKYFKTLDDATGYARHPERIANRVYANRMGNGDESSGDGWRFRGRGLIQLTGRESYKLCGESLGVDFEMTPDLLLSDANASMSAGWEWEMKNCNEAIDAGNFEKVCRLINGGLNGYAMRLELWEKAKNALEV